MSTWIDRDPRNAPEKSSERRPEPPYEAIDDQLEAQPSAAYAPLPAREVDRRYLAEPDRRLAGADRDDVDAVQQGVDLGLRQQLAHWTTNSVK